MIKNFVEELKWRGMLAQIMPGTEEYLQKNRVSAYLGTDPTADSLHIGHLCGIMMLRHLQRCGHKPYLLIGGATGMIGDPSGKNQERNLLDSATLYHNQEAIKKQVSKFLSFDSEEPNKAEMVNNYDWMKDFSFLDFAREVGKHITVNYMMAKESVQKRLNGEARDGLSFTEFTYQLLQGYDFLYQYQHYGVRLQLGGNDQWGNMTTGTELIRRTLGNDAEAYCLTCPLITKADGKKFGNLFKSSVFGKSVGYEALQNRFKTAKEKLKEKQLAPKTKWGVEQALRRSATREDFRDNLHRKGIDVLFRENEQGRLYGITFIDHNNGCVVNGSRLGKELSANAVAEWFDRPYPELSDSIQQGEKSNLSQTPTSDEDSVLGGLLDLPLEVHGTDWEEEQFRRRMQRKKRKHRKI